MAKKNEKIPAPEWYLKLEARYLEAAAMKQEAEAEMEKIRTSVMIMMENDEMKSVCTDLTQASYVEASYSRRFNSTDFKRDYPELYEQYAPKFHKNAYITIKLK